MNETDELAAIRHLQSNRLRALLAGAGAITLSLFAIGCPEAADLENPPANMTGGTGSNTAGTAPGTAGTTPGTAGTGTGGSGGGSGGTGGGKSPCEVACVDTIFKSPMANGCKLCHTGALTLSGLNLMPPGYTERLANKPAQHGDGDPMGTGEMPLPPSAGCPTDALLINTNNPGESWLWKKLQNQQDMCGTLMPSGTALPAADMACMKTYIECVAGKPIAGGSGGSGTGGTGGSGTGGSGGSAGGSGGTGGT